MIIESYEYVIYTAMFLLPGYLMNWIISILVPQRNGDQTDKVLRYLGYSLFNFTAWIWLFWLIRHNIEVDRTLYWLILSLAVVVTSSLTGVLFGVIRNKGCLRKLFAKFGLQIEHLRLGTAHLDTETYKVLQEVLKIAREDLSQVWRNRIKKTLDLCSGETRREFNKIYKSLEWDFLKNTDRIMSEVNQASVENAIKKRKR